MADTFADRYSLEPWSGWSINQRDWWVPEVLWAWRQTSNYQRVVPLRVNFAAVATKKMTWTGLYHLEPNYNSVPDTSLWLEKMYPAGWYQEMTLNTYAGGMGLHKFHPLITFFNAGGGQGALRELTRQYVTAAMMDQLETQIFHGFLKKSTYKVAGGVAGTGGFSEIAAADLYNPTIGEELSLDFKYMKIAPPNTGGPVGQLAFVSPGQTYAVKNDNTNWRSILQYSDWGIQKYFNGEVGSFRGVRFVETPINVLFNHGTLTCCSTILAAVDPGDGAPDPETTTIDGVKRAGQKTVSGSVEPTYYIQLGAIEADFLVGWDTNLATTMALFAEGQIVTLHTLKSDGNTNPYDVEHAPTAPADGTVTYRQIKSVDTVNGRITLDQPVQKPLQTDLGSGIYGYASIGVHIHAGIHMGAPGGVVGGFAQPPALMFPPTVDDRMAQYRATWDGVYEYEPFKPEVYHIIYSAGQVSMRGFMGTGG